MGNMSFFDGIIDEKLLNLNTAFIAKVISFKGDKADLQPLTMVKQYGRAAQKPAPIKNAPVVLSARFRIESKEISYTGVSGSIITETILKPIPLSSGDLVFCVCADRDITEARKGKMSTPQIGHHSLSDTVVVGVL